MFKRLSLYTFLLCLVPFFVWGFSYQWHGNGQLMAFDHFLYFLTETGSSPYALITCALFALIFGIFFKTRKQWILGVIIMAFAVIATQVVKTGLKATFAEPRPYIAYVVEHTGITTEQFYQESKEEQANRVEAFFVPQGDTPTWLVNHYKHEVGYSFPSGHTIFAATWLLLAVGFRELTGTRTFKTNLLIGVLTLWSILMLISRVRLGMHYPIDLLVATLAAWIINLGIFSFLKKKRSLS